MRLLFATSLALLLNRCLADTPPVKDTTSAPENPGLNYLMSVNATVGVIYDFGTGPYGKREIATITGGTVTGPKLSGSVLNLGANWILGDTKGALHPDGRAAFRTDDGAYVYVQLTGSGPGIKIGSITYTNVLLETSSDKYWWLNDIVAVSQMSVTGAWVGLDVWYLPGSAVGAS